jgi:hypothetical protein
VPNATLTVDTVTRIATEVAREQSPPVRIVGTVLSSRGAEYAEIVVSIEGCHQEPCQLQLGVFRNVDVQTLRGQIADQLLRHLAPRHS